MAIPLKLGAKPVRQRQYRLNPRYKEKLRLEIQKMLDVGIIEPVEESEWISPMVVQDKKIGEIKICVDLRKLNDACLTDPFPTPFIDEVLDSIGGHEAYSFTDGFSGYDHIKLLRKIGTRQHLQWRKAITSILLCHLGSRMPQPSFQELLS